MAKVFLNQIINDDCEAVAESHGQIWSAFRNKSVLVTGAYGMLASYFVYELIYLNETRNWNTEITVLVRNHEKVVARFGDYTARDYFHVNTQSLTDVIAIDEKIDFIIHAASLASPQYYGKFPVDVILPNIIGTYQLLELARRKHISRFILFSTGSVYGDIDNSDPITEESIGTLRYLEPGNCYGESKRTAELLLESYYRQYSVPYSSVRIFHTYGPTMDYRHDKRVFSEFVRNAVDQNDIVIKSSGEDRRCFCYITDAINAFACIALRGSECGIYNMANPYEFLSINDLAQIVSELSGVGVVHSKRENSDEYVPSRVIAKSPPSIDKLLELGWELKVDAKTGFMRTIKGVMCANNGV